MLPILCYGKCITDKLSMIVDVICLYFLFYDAKLTISYRKSSGVSAKFSMIYMIKEVGDAF